jgi:NADPH-dependent curcumin reductase CurA
VVIVNRQITLGSRPCGFPKISDFQLAYSALPLLAAGEALVRTLYLSLDPCMRGRMSDAESYARPLAIGEVMPGGVVAVVVQSEDSGFRTGEVVEGMLGWQEYAVARGSELRKVDPDLAPISTALGVLGMPGLAAYFGLLEIGAPRDGETVVVSGAAGAVGMLAGQIAKIKGCRVVGVASSDAEISWLRDELGLDATFNYRAAEDLEAALEELCPVGVDVYFDNVGGVISDAVIRRINRRARIVVCEQISQDNLEAPELGPRWLSRLIFRQARVEGFRVSDYAERFPEGRAQLAVWLKQGKLRYREDIAQGIEAAPQAFIGMLHGNNQGKQLVQLSGL